jgi:hypothetical protein
MLFSSQLAHRRHRTNTKSSSESAADKEKVLTDKKKVLTDNEKVLTDIDSETSTTKGTFATRGEEGKVLAATPTSAHALVHNKKLAPARCSPLCHGFCRK